MVVILDMKERCVFGGQYHLFSFRARGRDPIRYRHGSGTAKHWPGLSKRKVPTSQIGGGGGREAARCTALAVSRHMGI